MPFFLLYTHIKTKIYRTMNFHIFLRVCNKVSHPKERTCRLKVFDNTKLKNSLELKTEEVSGL